MSGKNAFCAAAMIAIGAANYLISIPPAIAQVETIASGVVTQVALGSLFSKIDGSIKKAAERADYLLVKALVEAKDALQAWEVTNTKLLNTAFGQLDKQTRDLFNSTNALVDKLDFDTAENLKKAQEITEQAQQIAKSIPGNDQSIVLRYLPKIAPPRADGTFVLRLRGANLNTADPQVLLDGRPLKRISDASALEAEFEVPIAALPRLTNEIRVYQLGLKYTTKSNTWWKALFGSREIVERTIAIATLPQKLASVEYKTTLNLEEKIAVSYKTEPQQFEAINDTVYKIMRPDPRANWRWDLNAPLKVVQGSGESARCGGVDMNQSSENGVMIFARCDEIRRIESLFGTVNRKPGYVSCALEGTVYRMETKAGPGPTKQGDMGWIEPLDLPVPDKLKEFSLKVRLFDNSVVPVSGDSETKFFRVARASGHLIVTPKTPADIID